MEVTLTNDNGTYCALSNEFKQVPIFIAKLEDEDGVHSRLEIINEYSIFKSWIFKLKTAKRLIYERTDKLGGVHYLVLKEYE